MLTRGGRGPGGWSARDPQVPRAPAAAVAALQHHRRAWTEDRSAQGAPPPTAPLASCLPGEYPARLVGAFEQPVEAHADVDRGEREKADGAEVAQPEADRRILGLRLVEEHHLHHTRIVVEGDHAVQEPDDYQRVETRPEPGPENAEIAG